MAQEGYFLLKHAQVRVARLDELLYGNILHHIRKEVCPLANAAHHKTLLATCEGESGNLCMVGWRYCMAILDDEMLSHFYTAALRI